MARPSGRWMLLILALGAVAVAAWAVRFDVVALATLAFLLDVVIGIAAMLYGRRRASGTILTGGALCLLLATTSWVRVPGSGTLVMLAIAALLGIVPVIFRSVRDGLD